MPGIYHPSEYHEYGTGATGKADYSQDRLDGPAPISEYTSTPAKLRRAVDNAGSLRALERSRADVLERERAEITRAMVWLAPFVGYRAPAVQLAVAFQVHGNTPKGR